VFLERFWDYEKSVYVREKAAHGQRLGRLHCYLTGLHVVRYWKPFFGEEKKLNEVTRADLREFSFWLCEKELASESVNKIMSDMILTVSPKDADTDAFLLEAQTARDENMALRVFQYAYAYARQNKHRADDDNLITLTMPDAKVFYWETAGRTHEELICRLVFPDKSIHDYTAGTVKVFERSIEEMAATGMTLLLPFSILKIRNEVKKTGLTAGRRGELAEEMAVMLFKIDEVTTREQRRRHISAWDAAQILERTDYLHGKLYGKYPEFKERYMEFEEQIKSRWHFDKEQEFLERGRIEGLERGRVEGLAKGLDIVLDLLKKGYSEAQIREAVLKANDKIDQTPQPNKRNPSGYDYGR
jgi:hypothetical protein